MKKNSQLTLRAILLFFLPLLFMMELIQISHSITNAFLARLAASKEVLAAFSIAFAFCVTANGATMIGNQAGICFITDRTSALRLLRFFTLLVMIPFFILEFTALTPFGDIVFGEWMGTSPAVVRQAKNALAIMGLWTFPVLIRNFAYAIVMNRRRTILITYATAVRLVSLIFFLVLFSRWFNGAVVGALATVSGMTVEAVYMVIVARPFYARLGRDADNPATYREFWTFCWPLIITQTIENGVLLVINFFLGNLATPDLAIASFGVVYSLLRILLAPLRNLVQAAQALLKKRADLVVMFKFTLGLILFYIGINFLLFYTPMNSVILNGIMGLSPELSSYSTPSVRLIFTVAVFWATASLLRGILSGMRKTRFIAVAAGIRLAVVAGIGYLSFFYPGINGSVLGVLSLAGSFAVETLILGWHLHGQAKMSGLLFPSRDELEDDFE
jgi:Na+-driven multidrug efflux pump